MCGFCRSNNLAATTAAMGCRESGSLPHYLTINDLTLGTKLGLWTRLLVPVFSGFLLRANRNVAIQRRARLSWHQSDYIAIEEVPDRVAFKELVATSDVPRTRNGQTAF
jgi:hypothetical protein